MGCPLQRTIRKRSDRQAVVRTERLHHPHLQLLEASFERKLRGFCSPGHHSFGRKTEKVDQIHQMSRCYKDSGVNLGTNTMANWMMRATEIEGTVAAQGVKLIPELFHLDGLYDKTKDKDRKDYRQREVAPKVDAYFA